LRERKPLRVLSLIERVLCDELLVEIFSHLSAEDLRNVRGVCKWFRTFAEDVLERVLPYGERCWMSVARMLTFKGVNPLPNRSTEFYRKLKDMVISEQVDIPELLTAEVVDIDLYTTLVHYAGYYTHHSDVWIRAGKQATSRNAVGQGCLRYDEDVNGNVTAVPRLLPNVVGGDPTKCIHRKCCQHRDFKCWRLAYGDAGYCQQCKHTVSYTLKSRGEFGNNVVLNFIGDRIDTNYVAHSDSDTDPDFTGSSDSDSDFTDSSDSESEFDESESEEEESDSDTDPDFTDSSDSDSDFTDSSDSESDDDDTVTQHLPNGVVVQRPRVGGGDVFFGNMIARSHY